MACGTDCITSYDIIKFEELDSSEGGVENLCKSLLSILGEGSICVIDSKECHQSRHIHYELSLRTANSNHDAANSTKES